MSALLILAPLGLCAGAGCGTSEDVSIGEVDTESRQGSPCAVEACGPQPGTPAETCADGTPGGFTGRCLAATDGRCAWEVRTCPAAPPAPTNEGEIAAAVSSFFQAKCLNCHGNGRAFGALDNILNVDDLRSKGLVLDTASNSPLFTMLATHPEATAVDPVTGEPVVPPTEAEIDFVRQWIDLGAPPLPPPPRPDPANEEEIVAAVASFFQQKCLNCHGNGYAFGGLPDILNVDDLRSKGFVLNTATISPLFTMLATHPAPGWLYPVTNEPVALTTKQEADFVRQWIDLGAPPLR